MGLLNVFTQAESLSGSAPTLATEGVSLEGAKSYRLILAADATRTLSGAGTYKVYHYNDASGWAEDPRLAGSVTTSGIRSIILDEREIGVPIGRVRVVLTSVTVSAGAASIIYQLGN